MLSGKKTLQEYILIKVKEGKSRFRAIAEAYDEIMTNKLAIIDPNPPESLLSYLGRLDYSLWFWFVTIFAVVTPLFVLLSLWQKFLIPVRYVLGFIYVLFVPGYVTLRVLYDEEKELSSLETLVYSIGISLAIIPFMGLLLNFTPAGLSMEQIFILISSYTVVMAFVASRAEYLRLLSRLRT